MQATQLKNPGDFHQITHQIRELVAYAISQLEIARDAGSVPSGKFADFLLDAAKQTPGYTGGSTGYGPNSVLLTAGDQIPMDDKMITVTIDNGVLTGSHFTNPRVAHITQGQLGKGWAGGSTIDTYANVVSPNKYIGTSANDKTFALVKDGAVLPMHDQGGAAGQITAKVVNNEITDMVFTTPGAHLLRDGQRLMLTDRGGDQVEVVYTIAPDGKGSLSMADPNVHIAVDGDTIVTAGHPNLGSVLGTSPGRVGMIPSGEVLFQRKTDSVSVMNYDVNAQYGLDNPRATPRTTTGADLASVLLPPDCFVLKHNVPYPQGDRMAVPNIQNGKFISAQFLP